MFQLRVKDLRRDSETWGFDEFIGRIRYLRYTPNSDWSLFRIIHMYTAASIWFEIWELVGPSRKISIFPGKFQGKNFPGKNFNFPGKPTKYFDFSRQKFPNDLILVIYSKMSVYSGKICHLQRNSSQIILFRLKSHHFRTYFLYMIR